MDDEFKAAFRAARTEKTQKLSKDQIKALKAQKAAAQADEDAKRDASMPPPPPRRPADHPLASYHADSQGTRINDGSATLLTSEPSVTQQQHHTGTHQAGAPGSTSAPVAGLPAGFFGSNPAAAQEPPPQSAEGAALPRGFFSDAAADAIAQGTAKTEEELDQEYADFMKQVETESAVVEETAAAEQVEEADDKEIRDEFEHFVRMERIKELKAAGIGKKKRKADDDNDKGAAPSTTKEVLEAAMITVDADPLPQIQMTKKKRVIDTLQELEGDTSDSDSNDEDLLDWRAKKTK